MVALVLLVTAISACVGITATLGHYCRPHHGTNHGVHHATHWKKAGARRRLARPLSGTDSAEDDGGGGAVTTGRREATTRHLANCIHTGWVDGCEHRIDHVVCQRRVRLCRWVNNDETATAAQLAAMRLDMQQRFARLEAKLDGGDVINTKRNRNTGRLPKCGVGGAPDVASTEPVGVGCQPVGNTFCRAGSHWDVTFEGRKSFHLRHTLGAEYLDYLLHHPGEVISAYDLELKIRPDKAKARAKDSVQNKQDPEAIRSYLRQLEKMRAEREEAAEDGDMATVDQLDGDMEAIEAELKKNGQAPDAGERARWNVSKAIAAVLLKLRKGGEGEKAFAAHLEQFISMGYQFCYSQPQGNRWF
jgi:hypothetical protein